MAQVPPFVLDMLQKLPEPVQEKLQAGMMKMMQDKYYLAMSTIPFAYLLCYLPHLGNLAARISVTGPLKYNNDTPRTEKVEDYPRVMARCMGAHYNSLEMFPAFAAAVLFAKVQKGDAVRVTELATRYVKLRIAYVFLYICGVNKVIQYGRTVVWFGLLRTVLEIYGQGLF